MDYIEKMQDLLKKFSPEEVAENLYLNYHSVMNNDEVFKIKKRIADEYKCNINDVKLIGSAHTGYTYKNNKLLKRENPKDYDFAIINVNVFIHYFHKCNMDNVANTKTKSNYNHWILKGKLHPLYFNTNLKNEINQTNQKIMEDLMIERHISICFYISEKAFIDGLIEYNKNLYLGILREITDLDLNVEDVSSFGIREIDKLEDK